MGKWNDKLNASKPHEVKQLNKDMMGMKAGQMMLIASPKMVDDFIRTIPEGKSMDVVDVRRALASANGAEVTCPITTGIFLRIVAEAAWEAHVEGAKVDEITPVWRVINKKMPLVKKLQFDPQFLWLQRERENLTT